MVHVSPTDNEPMRVPNWNTLHLVIVSSTVVNLTLGHTKVLYT